MRIFAAISFLFISITALSQSTGENTGIINGNVLDEKQNALQGATVELIRFEDSLNKKTTLSDKNGYFFFNNISFGYYRLRISFVGLQSLSLDSIYFRKERFDFNLNDIVLKSKTNEQLQEVVIYAEKPLIESKDGNITFNASESPLSAGSNAGELLEKVPLVTKDPDGKINVRGKEPKILIDDKPVELNLQQLQDLLESMPGSSIEKIEVMTNPPPQYANEPGGVINITTRKGKVGKSGRISVYAGTRGEEGMNGSFNYRQKGFAISINAGVGYNRFSGNGYSRRENIYSDSVNYFNTSSEYQNKNIRPNFRANIDYDITKNQSLNFVAQYNQNDFDNHSLTEYTNINDSNEIYKLSDRSIHSTGDSYNPNFNLSYTVKGKILGESLKIISGYNFSNNENTRDFYQQYFNPDHSWNGLDSTQQQINNSKNNGYSVRVNYDKPLSNMKTFFSFGGFYNRSSNHVIVDASYLKKPDSVMEKMDLLSNDFRFHQSITNLRATVRQVIAEHFRITAGLTAEATNIWFQLIKDGTDAKNNYWTYLPFGNINKNWNDKYSLTFSYRRSIRRPGIYELNPAIDYSDPYNIRFGNPALFASTADNFDLVLGKTKPKYFINLAWGYNIVKDIFSQVRTLLPDGKTQITWQNISGRKEYEMSSWNSFTIIKGWKLNLSATYVYSTYNEFDKTVRNYRDGGSFTSNINSSFTFQDIWNITGSMNLNRFANPQGYAQWSTSMNIGVQRKLLDKKLTITLNIIDPFRQQQTRSYTYGPNFNLESFSTGQTRDFRVTVSYNFTKKPTDPLQNLLQKK